MLLTDLVQLNENAEVERLKAGKARTPPRDHPDTIGVARRVYILRMGEIWSGGPMVRER